MALKFTPTYTSENERIYDLAQSNPLFKEEDFNSLLSTNKAYDYTRLLAGIRNEDLSSFNFGNYNYLNSEDKFGYIVNEFYQDRDETYTNNLAYFNNKIDEAIAAETWNSLSGFKKVVNTVGGILGNVFNAVYSIGEGLLDISTLLVGTVASVSPLALLTGTGKAVRETTKEVISKDATGTGAIQEELNEFNKKYTYIDKNKVVGFINEVTTSIGQMAPLALNVVAPGLGNLMYYSAMAGRTAETTIKANPDINYGNLLAYVGSNTLLEYGTEFISGKFFGLSGMDKIFGRTSSKVSTNILGRLGKDFVSEGLEEAVSEMGDSILYRWLVDPKAPKASMSDIFHAALVGGFTGLVMTGGNVISTRNRVITTDGRIMTQKQAKELNLKVKESLGKFKSNVLLDTISFGNQLLQKDAVADLQRKYRTDDMSKIQKEHASEYSEAVQKNQKRDSELVKVFSNLVGTKTDSFNQLLNKYSYLTLEQIRTQHKEEYDQAFASDEKRTQSSLAALAGFNRIVNTIGETGLKKAVEILNYHTTKTAEAARRFISSYNTRSSNAVFAAIEDKYRKLLPGQSIKIDPNLTGIEQQFQTEISGKGIRVFFADFGAVPGAEVKKGFAVDENTIILEKGLVEREGVDAAWNKVIKVELVRALQFDSGILTAKALADLDSKYSRLMPETTVSVDKNIDEAYAEDSELSQIARIQAETYAQILLFDDISLSKIYRTNTNIFKKVYNWMKGTTDNLSKLTRSDKRAKLKYNTLLKTMRNYRKTVAEQCHNMEDVENATSLLQLSTEEAQKLIDTYLPNPSLSPIALLRQEDSASATQRTEVINELQSNRPLETRNEPLDYDKIFDTGYYTPEFRDKILSRNENLNFKDNLQEYLMNSKGFLINQSQKCLMETLDLNRVTSKEFNESFAKKDLSKFTSLEMLFDKKFTKRLNRNQLKNTPINFVTVEQDQPRRVVRNEQGIVVYVSPTELSRTAMSEFKNEILNEVAFIIADINGFANGVSQGFVHTALDAMNETKIRDLAGVILTAEYLSSNPNIEAIKTDLAFAIYRITDGYYTDTLPAKKTTRNELPEGGFKVDDNGRLIGYGRLAGTNLEVKDFTDFLRQQRVERVATAQEEIAFVKTNDFKNWLTKKGLNYETMNFSEEFISEMSKKNNRGFEDIAYRLIAENKVGDEKTSNILISYLVPNNKNIKTIQDVQNAINNLGIQYAYAFAQRAEAKNKNKPGAVDVNTPRSYDFLIKNQEKYTPYIAKALADNRLTQGLASETAIKNNIARLILATDYNYSVSQTLEIVKQIKNRESFDKSTVRTGINAEGEAVSITDILTDEALSPEDALIEAQEIKAEPEQVTVESTKKRIEENLNETNPEAFRTRERLNTNRDAMRELLNMSETEYEAYLKSLDFTTKDAFKLQIKRRLEKISNRTGMTKADESFVKKDVSVFETPKEFKEYITGLDNIISRTEAAIEVKQPTISTKVETDALKAATPSEQINVKKSNTISEAILNNFAEATKDMSEMQYSEATDKVYTKVAYDMIEENAGLFTTINDENYAEVRQDLSDSRAFYAPQALIIFDLYTLEMKGKFSPEIQSKIEDYNRRITTQSAQKLAIQSRRVAERKPISNLVTTFANNDLKVTITDEMIREYDEKLKDKDAYIEELSNRIKDLETQIKESTNELERTALLREVKEVSDSKLIIQNGTNADIMDWIVNNAETVERATTIQQEILDKLIKTAEESQAKKKEVGTFLYDKNGKPKPFPKVREKLFNVFKKLKSFRLWSMLSAPVTWVKNWVGNQGMKGLDSATNFVERLITARTNFNEQQLKFNETRAGKDVYKYIGDTHHNYIMSIIRGKDVKYEITAEKFGDVERQIRKSKYESATAFQKAIYKAQDMVDWGLNTGPLGDEPILFNNISKTMGNLVANNTPQLLTGIENELGRFRARKNLTDIQQERMNILEKAVSTKSPIDVLNALSKEETERLFDIAKTQAFEQFFKNQNWLSKALSNLGKKNPVMAEVVSWIMPFPKVAGNILTMAYKYSPLNFISALRQWSTLKQMGSPDYKGVIEGTEQAELIKNISQASVGTFMLIAGAIAAAFGWVDIDDDDYLGPSLVLGDVRVSLSNLAPSMTTFSTAAGMLWAFKNDKSAFTTALDILSDNTLLGNIDNIMRYNSLSNFVENLSISYISQYVPSIVKLTNRFVTNGTYKDKSGNYFQKLAKTLGSYIPGVSEFVPNKINPYTGANAYRTGTADWWFNIVAGLSPIEMIKKASQGIEAEADRINAETSGLSGDFKINGVDITLQNKEKEQYSIIRAKYINTHYNSIISGKEQVTVERDSSRITTTYDKLTDDEKKKVLNNLYTKATEHTKIQYWINTGNTYVVNNYDKYLELLKEYSNAKNIIYRATHTGSKFIPKK